VPVGRPRRLATDFGDDLVGSAVEHLQDLVSGQLLDRHMNAVGVALNGHFGCCGRVIETMRAGTAVEFGDEVPGGGDHDRVEPGRLVGSPSREGILRCGGEVTDMNAGMIKVEVECLGFAFAEGELCCRFTRGR
jgi:hypothetical protein